MDFTNQITDQMEPESEVDRLMREFDDVEDYNKRVESDVKADDLIKTNQLDINGPTQDDYDYKQAYHDGAPLTSDSEQPIALPNNAIKPHKKGIAGYDIATGEDITGQFTDDEGWIKEGVEGLRNSHQNIGAEAPEEDVYSLAKVANGVMKSGGGFKDFKETLPEGWSQQQVSNAWRSADELRFIREDLPEMQEAAAETPYEQEPMEESYSEDQLKDTPKWLDAVRGFHQYLEGEPFQGSDEELSDYGKWRMSGMNNLAYLGIMTSRAVNGSDAFTKSLYDMMAIYDNTEMSMDAFGRGLAAVGLDPSTYLGVRLFAAPAVKGGAIILKKALQHKMARIAAIGAAEGATYGAIESTGRQVIAGQHTDEDVDPAQVAMHAGAGAVLGAALPPAVVAGAAGIKRGVGNLQKAPGGYRSGGRMSQRGSVGIDINKFPGMAPEADMVNASRLMQLDQNAMVDTSNVAPPTVQVTRMLDQLASESTGGRVLNPKNDMNELADRGAREVMEEIDSSGGANAVEWYRETMANAGAIRGEVFPETLTEPTKQVASNFALAVTSQGQNVSANVKLADQAYRVYRETGRFPETFTQGGPSGKIMAGTFKKYNDAIDIMGEEQFQKVLFTDFTPAELKAVGLIDDYKGEAANAALPGSLLMGPKIGAGFFSNLNGRWDIPTFDLWWTRTYGRLTGKVRQDRLPKHLPNLRKQVGFKKNAKTMEAFNPLPENLADDEAMTDWAMTAYGQWARRGHPDEKNAVHKQIRSIMGREKAKDTPAGGVERQQMRDLVTEIKDRVNAHLGTNLDEAAVQATLWFPEQRLWDRMGSKQTGRDNDYEKAFREYYRADLGDSELARSGGGSARTAGAEAGGAGGRGVLPEAGRAGGLERPELSERERSKFISQGTTRNLREQHFREYSEGAPRSHGRTDSGDGESIRILGSDVKSVATYSPSTGKVGHKKESISTNWAFDQANISKAPIHEIGPETSADFHKAISKSAKEHAFGASVYVYPEPDYKDMRTFVMDNGKAGFAIKPDGDIVSVFSSSTEPNNMISMMSLAIQEGGRKLDAFDTILPNFYSVLGMKPVAKVPWDNAEAPPAWDKKAFAAFNRGEPDVVMMVYDPAYQGVASADLANMPHVDYGEALRLQEEAMLP